MLVRVTWAPSVTTQSASLEGVSMKGGPIEPMLEICASPGDLPVVPANSQSAVDLDASHRFVSFGGDLDGTRGGEAAPFPFASIPRISRVSWLRAPLWKRNSL